MCKSEHLGVGELASQLSFHLVEVFDFLGREGQAFRFVVFLKVFDAHDGCGFDVYAEDVLVQPVVHALEHGVVLSLTAADGEILLDACNAFQSHVLGDFHGIGAPGCNHFAAGTHVPAFDVGDVEGFGLSVEPAEFLDFVSIEFVVNAGSDDAFGRSSEKAYHRFILKFVIFREFVASDRMFRL